MKGGVVAGAAWAAPIVASGVARAAGTPPPPPDPCTICGSNAVVNGNANNGLTGWTSLGTITTPAYTPGFPAPSPAAPNLYFNLTNPGGSATRILQFVNIPAACIGRAVTLTGYARAQAGLFNAEIRYFNGATSIGFNTTPLISPSSMTPFTVGGTIPASTTRIRVFLNFQRALLNPVGQLDLISLIIACQP